METRTLPEFPRCVVGVLQSDFAKQYHKAQGEDRFVLPFLAMEWGKNFAPPELVASLVVCKYDISTAFDWRIGYRTFTIRFPELGWSEVWAHDDDGKYCVTLLKDKGTEDKFPVIKEFPYND